MIQTVLLIAGIVIGFLVMLLRGQATSAKADAVVLDLTNRIADKKKLEAAQGKTSDAAVKGYLDALKEYDPDFHNNDGSGKPSN